MGVLKLFIALMLLFLPIYAVADTHTAGDCELATVSALIDSVGVTTGDVVIVPSGSCTWDGLTMTKSITLQGNGYGTSGTIITLTNSIVSSGDDVVIKNFYFKADGDTLTSMIVISGDDWRVTGSKFESTGVGDTSKMYGVHPSGTTANPGPKGLIDNNYFVNTQVVTFGSAAMLEQNDTQHALWAEDFDLAGPTAVYIENNTFEMTDEGNVIDGGYGARFVARYNNITSPGWGYILEVHGVQGYNRAVIKWEFYNNLLIGNDKYEPIEIRGGSGVIFNNQLAGTFINETIVLTNDRSFRDVGAGICDGDVVGWDTNSDATGYACRDQIGVGKEASACAGTELSLHECDQTPGGNKAYIWGNKKVNSDTLGITVSAAANHIQENRDYVLSEKPGYAIYTCPHPLVGTGSCDSSTAGRNGYHLGNATFGSGASMSIGSGAVMTLQ